jgi:hypothetical protein
MAAHPQEKRSESVIRITEKGVFSSLIFIFGCVILFMTRDMRTDVALVPQMVGVLLLVFSGVQVLMDIFPAAKKRLSFLDQGATGSIGGEGVVQEDDEPGDSLATRYRFFGWVAAFIALIYLTSMIWATTISLFVYLKWINKESWLMSVLYSLATALFIYVVFVLGFKLDYFL